MTLDPTQGGTHKGPAPRPARRWPDETLYLGKEVSQFTQLLAEYQSEHAEAAGKDGCFCKLCTRYEYLPWDLFLPPSDDPYHREMEAKRRDVTLGLAPEGKASHESGR